eukprot:TRINITY_DN22649_c0_g6_i1.p1 TRINITY_DN22649_c0_g6~~TRINITY_DN22649_c0_g6_i1.p1  ORF type:complete len:603 (-),score=121.37 TRINITY_DN22649_c0_g6_i1:386-2194(-)
MPPGSSSVGARSRNASKPNASAAERRPPAADGGGAGRHHESVRDGGGGHGRAARPRSAQPLLSRADEAAIALQAACLELKTATNNLDTETKMNRTRAMALERELQKREKLLRQLALLNKSGQGIGADVVERLREERNMLPIFKRKVQDLEAQIEEAEAEIRELKRDPQFTRIVELQVEYASWQHEARRLAGLIQETDLAASDALRREVEVHDRRVEKLEAEVNDAEEKRAALDADIAEVEADHASWKEQYERQEEELKQQQALTKNRAVSFKQLLLERKQVEQLQGEIEEMNLHMQRYDEELRPLASALKEDPVAAPAPLGRRAISRAALHDDPTFAVSPATSSGLLAVRRASAAKSACESFVAQLEKADSDADGFVTALELSHAITAIGCELSPTQVMALSEELVTALPFSDDQGRIRWLDLLVYVDRVGTSICRQAGVPLPPMRPLRAACLQSSIGAEELRRRLEAVTNLPQLEAFLQALGLCAQSVASWVDAFEAYGTDGVLLRLPLAEAARSESCRCAWRSRCVDAVRAHVRELKESFPLWRADMLLTEAQFTMVCSDVLGAELSEDDIVDLGLLATVTHDAGEMVDGSAVLRLADAC